ncbi:MAG: hypothetical protein JO218_06435 [Burkholderiales bacterium]|nr:hypothetical protein [Burkholderiales bacterium]
MRTFDKLIATIHTGQGNGGLRSSFGLAQAGGARSCDTAAILQADG